MNDEMSKVSDFLPATALPVGKPRLVSGPSKLPGLTRSMWVERPRPCSSSGVSVVLLMSTLKPTIPVCDVTVIFTSGSASESESFVIL